MSNDVNEILGFSRVVETRRGKITVRELMFEDATAVFSSFVGLFKGLSPDELKLNDLATVVRVMQGDSLATCMKAILCQVTDQKAGFYDKFPLNDMLKVISAFVEVNDLREIARLFFDLRNQWKAASIQTGAQKT